MKRWHISIDWVLVWGLTLFLGGAILYIGYLSSDSPNSEASIPTFQKTESEVSRVTVTKQGQTANNIKYDQLFQEEIKLVFGKSDSDKISLGIKDFPSPVDGPPLRGVGNYYSENLGNYVFHAGTDYALAEGTVIRATHGGKVIFAGEDPILAQKVSIDCGEGWLITYGGLDNLRVQEGQVIETQEALGQAGLFPGTESKTKSPQLHYEVWHNGEVQLIKD